MPRRSSTPPPPLPSPQLQISRQDAASRLKAQLDRGAALLAALQVGRSEGDFDRISADTVKWAKYVEQLLSVVFTPADKFVTEWRMATGPLYINASPAQRFQSRKRGLELKVQKVESFIERLELIPDAPGVGAPAVVPTAGPGDSRKVFVVHGRDEGKREAACRVLEKLDLTPIVLHEQANQGRTVIEKFEHHSDVDFAVVIVTGDDAGVLAGSDEPPKPRARQNVILELGYFIGKLGRNRVCALYESGVELPSDILGIAYVPLDGPWQYEFARELKAAGIDVDMNRL